MSSPRARWRAISDTRGVVTSPEQRDARIAELEKRMTRLERTMFVFQATVAARLTAAVKLMRGRQAERQARVGEALGKLAAELAMVRDRLGAITGTSRLTH